jgi:hypothetical protein
MKLVYLGADVPSNRVIMEKMGVKNVGVSFWRLKQRGLPKNKEYLLSNYFPEYMSIHVHPGIPDSTTLSPLDFEDFLAEYEHFLSMNIDRITSFMELDHPLLAPGLAELQRGAAWNDEGDKFWVVLQPNDTYTDIVDLAQEYKNIGIPYAMLESDTSLSSKVRSIKTQYGTHFHAIACAKPDNLRQVPVETASTQSWLSPMMRGETIVWDGNKLVRYPKKMKDQARPRYKAVYEKAGLDFDKIMGDDPVEVAKLALWSYDQFEERFNMVNNPYLMPEEEYDDEELYTNSPNTSSGKSAETTLPVVDNKGTSVRKLEVRNSSEMTTLPVFATEIKTVIERDEEGREVVKDVPIIKSSTSSLRMCDTCFVAANCPAFKPQTTCSFNLPIKVETKEQLRSLLTAIVEMQGQRVAFARFSEELNGGYPDPNTGQEMDRLLKMVKTIKDLEDTSSFVRMTVEAKNGGGVLSQIFGEKAQHLSELPNGGLDENQTTRIIQQSVEG